MPKPEEIPNTHDEAEAERERWAAYCDRIAEAHEAEAKRDRNRVQRMIVPEPQLSKLKAAHWRIIARAIRENRE